jgi:AcrR family transcriptional regulator
MDGPSDRRAGLLNRIVDTLLAGGAADLSLRPLAEQVGTSARLLIYHFGSKDQLVADALAEVRRRVGVSLKARAAHAKPKSLRDLLMMFWEWALEPSNQPYFRLLFEVDGLAMYNRINFSQEVRNANSAVWVGLIDNAAAGLSMEAGVYSARSMLIMGALSGLLQEFLSTGDRDSTTAALSTLIDLISADGTPAPSKQRRRS